MINDLTPLLFVYAALITALLTYLGARRFLGERRGPNDVRDLMVELRKSDLAADIPEEILKQLSLMIRYMPVAPRPGESKNRIVHLEERLMLGNTPLTSWVKHRETLTGGKPIDGESIMRLSVLKPGNLAAPGPKSAAPAAIVN